MVAGREDEGGGSSGERGEGVLQIGMDPLGAGDEPRRARSRAEVARRSDRPLDDAWVAGEPEVVVAGQVDRLGIATGSDQPSGQARLLPSTDLVGEPVVEPTHGCTSAMAPTMALPILASSSPEAMYGGME